MTPSNKTQQLATEWVRHLATRERREYLRGYDDRYAAGIDRERAVEEARAAAAMAQQLVSAPS